MMKISPSPELKASRAELKHSAADENFTSGEAWSFDDEAPNSAGEAWRLNDGVQSLDRTVRSAMAAAWRLAVVARTSR
jgi:hypothetical protein